ncbi:MAG: hypothetical protein AAFV53_32340, partial [Myxococcota bacterium]
MTVDNTMDRVLYRHARRPEWGVAALVSSGDGRKSFQFEDGTLRTLKNEFCWLMEPLERSDEPVADLHTELERQGMRSLARRRADRMVDRSAKPQPSAKPLMSFSDQVKVFRSVYADGFQDSDYQENVRGIPGERTKKRLRNPSIQFAQKLWTPAALSALVEAGDHSGCVSLIADVLMRTDLVRPGQDVKPLRTMDPSYHESVSRAMLSLIKGSGSNAERLAGWQDALSRSKMSVNWAMVTAPLALVSPERHICIRPSVFAAQARLLAPGQHL